MTADMQIYESFRSRIISDLGWNPADVNYVGIAKDYVSVETNDGTRTMMTVADDTIEEGLYLARFNNGDEIVYRRKGCRWFTLNGTPQDLLDDITFTRLVEAGA